MSSGLIPDAGRQPGAEEEGQLSLPEGCRPRAVLCFGAPDQNPWLCSWAPAPATVAGGQVLAPLVAAPTLVLAWGAGIEFRGALCLDLRWSAYAVACSGLSAFGLDLRERHSIVWFKSDEGPDVKSAAVG